MGAPLQLLGSRLGGDGREEVSRGRLGQFVSPPDLVEAPAEGGLGKTGQGVTL